MTDTFDHERYATLKQHEAHEQTLPGMVFEEHVFGENDVCLYHVASDENAILSIYVDPDSPNVITVDDEDMSFEIRRCDIAAWIALLQRAAQIIEGGAS